MDSPWDRKESGTTGHLLSPRYELSWALEGAVRTGPAWY